MTTKKTLCIQRDSHTPAGPGPLSAIRLVGAVGSSKIECVNERVAALYEAHREGVYRFLVARGTGPAVAQELTQDVFMKLLIALGNGVPIHSEQGWLYGVAAKSAAEHWRREPTHMPVELDMNSARKPFTSLDPNPESLAVRTQEMRCIADALVQLPTEQRMCVQLRAEGFRYREIAQILGVAVSTVSEWLASAIEHLRRAANFRSPGAFMLRGRGLISRAGNI